MQPAHHRAPFSNPAQAESVSSRHARFLAPCTRRRVSQETIAPCRRQAVFLTSLTKKNSRTLSEARTESTRAFPGVKDTLHPPVAEKIVAAEAGQGSPHRRFALTLAGVASTVAAMAPEGAWPPDRGRVSKNSSADAARRVAPAASAWPPSTGRFPLRRGRPPPARAWQLKAVATAFD